jgi:hypothetical protein
MELRRLRIAVVSCLVCTWVLASSASADDDGEAPNKKPSDVSKCVKVRTEALYVAYGYDHHVHLTNGCDKAVRCEVTTSSNPEPTTAALAAGEHKDIVMFRGSPASAVNANVKCKPAAG